MENSAMHRHDCLHMSLVIASIKRCLFKPTSLTLRQMFSAASVNH